MVKRDWNSFASIPSEFSIIRSAFPLLTVTPQEYLELAEKYGHRPKERRQEMRGQGYHVDRVSYSFCWRKADRILVSHSGLSHPPVLTVSSQPVRWGSSWQPGFRNLHRRGEGVGVQGVVRDLGPKNIPYAVSRATVHCD